FVIVFLFIIRLSVTEYFWFIVLILGLFLLAPLIGLMKHLNLNWFYEDVVVATKWFNVPLSFFYFKNLIQRPQFVRLKSSLKFFLKSSFFLISINMIIGAAGLGMSFYYHGYGNAVGTKGYIYAGNELTLLIVTLGFISACYFKKNNLYFKYFISL